MNCSRLLAILAVLGSVVGLSAQASPPARLDAAMRAFWDADEAGDAEKAAKRWRRREPASTRFVRG